MKLRFEYVCFVYRAYLCMFHTKILCIRKNSSRGKAGKAAGLLPSCNRLEYSNGYPYQCASKQPSQKVITQESLTGAACHCALGKRSSVNDVSVLFRSNPIASIISSVSTRERPAFVLWHGIVPVVHANFQSPRIATGPLSKGP